MLPDDLMPNHNLIMELLETPFWPENIHPGVMYTRTHDDCDGNTMEQIQVFFSPDGDAWTNNMVDPGYKSLRFRTDIGGGKSLRVRNALLILAMAIEKDNEEFPQQENNNGKKN